MVICQIGNLSLINKSNRQLVSIERLDFKPRNFFLFCLIFFLYFSVFPYWKLIYPSKVQPLSLILVGFSWWPTKFELLNKKLAKKWQNNLKHAPFWFFSNFAQKCPSEWRKDRQFHLTPHSSSWGSKTRKKGKRLEVKPFKPFFSPSPSQVTKRAWKAWLQAF